MKYIDLCNLFAKYEENPSDENREAIPKKVAYNGNIYDLDLKNRTYYSEGDETELLCDIVDNTDYIFTQSIDLVVPCEDENDIEVLDIDEDEPIKELQIVKSDNHFYLVCDEGKHKIGKAQVKTITTLNRLIREINKKESDSTITFTGHFIDCTPSDEVNVSPKVTF